MHERVYELQKDPRDCGCMDPESFYETMLDGIADCVDNVEDMPEEIEWFKERFKDLFKVEDTTMDDGECPIYKVTLIGKEKHFADKIKIFNEQLEKLVEMKTNSSEDEILKDFMGEGTGKISNIFYYLKESYTDKFSAYVYHDGYADTLDSFLRNHKNGDVFYLSQAIDYHA